MKANPEPAAATLAEPCLKGLHVIFVCSACVACGSGTAAPCFDGTYEVELLERVDEDSTCPADWASSWSFQVAPKRISLKGVRGHCSPVALGLETSLPRNFTGLGIGMAGAIDGRYPSDDADACPAWSNLEALLPYGTENVPAAAADDAVLWRMDIIDIDESCGIPRPEGGRCIDVYRSRMTKVADWDAEEDP